MSNLTKSGTYISFKLRGQTCTVEFDRPDINIEEVYDAVVTVVTGVGFSKETWDAFIAEKVDEGIVDTIRGNTSRTLS